MILRCRPFLFHAASKARTKPVNVRLCMSVVRCMVHHDDALHQPAHGDAF